MPPEDKRIVIRVEKDEWTAYDDRRHGERTTFQELGLRLFREWLSGNKIIPTNDEIEHKKHANLHDSAIKLSNSEEPWVQALVSVLRSGNETAARAIENNLVAFLDYVRAVPETSNEYTDLAAEATRVAVLNRELDAIKAATVEGNRGAAKPRKEDTSRAHTQRARSGAQGKGVGR